MKQKIILAAIALSVLPAPAEQGASTNVLTLDAVLAEMRTKNPALKSARANWGARQARIRQEGAWADPRVGVDIERSDTTQLTTLTDAEWMISQEIPISGKNRRRAKAATAEAAAALAEVRRRDLDLVRDARSAFYNFVNAQAQLDLNQKNSELLQQFSDISRIKYEAGTRMQSDVLMAQTELLKNEELRRDLQQRLVEAQSRLNVLMNRSPDAALPRLVPPEPPDFNYDVAAVEARALQHRPELQIAEHKITAAKARHDLARRAWIPDPELRVEARQFNGGGGRIREYDTGIFFSFPWFNRGKYRAGIEEANENRESAEYALAASENETRGLVREQVGKVATLHHHYVLLHDRIVPLARQAVEATRISYNGDKATFLELIAALRTLRETESLSQHHRTDYLIAIAELEALIGAQADPPQPK